MKNLLRLPVVLLLFAGTMSCNAHGTNKEVSRDNAPAVVTVYYFHLTRRCATCEAVEHNSRNALEALFPEKIKSGEYSFIVLNIEEEAGKAIAEKLGVGGQTLLVVHGDKKIDITGKAFMYAQKPDKIKTEIKTAVEKVLL